MDRVRPIILAAAAVAALLVVGPAAAGTVAYRPPVPGPVIDPYRPPSTPYGPGNRGIDYATTPGEPVAAPADGEVTFAGPVGGGLHVVILHADGIRTSLSFLAAVLVRRGQRVLAGQPVGIAGASLHFGARRGEAYLDPSTLLAGTSPGGRALLVPDGPGRPLGLDEEAAGLQRLLAGGRWPAAARTAGASLASLPPAVLPPPDGVAPLVQSTIRAGRRPCPPSAGDCGLGPTAPSLAAGRGAPGGSIGPGDTSPAPAPATGSGP